MRQRSNVNDFYNLNSGTMNSTDGRLTAITGTFHISLHLSQTQVIGNLCTILCCHLGCIRSILLRATETHFTG